MTSLKKTTNFPEIFISVQTQQMIVTSLQTVNVTTSGSPGCCVLRAKTYYRFQQTTERTENNVEGH